LLQIESAEVSVQRQYCDRRKIDADFSKKKQYTTRVEHKTAELCICMIDWLTEFTVVALFIIVVVFSSFCRCCFSLNPGPVC